MGVLSPKQSATYDVISFCGLSLLCLSESNPSLRSSPYEVTDQTSDETPCSDSNNDAASRAYFRIGPDPSILTSGESSPSDS